MIELINKLPESEYGVNQLNARFLQNAQLDECTMLLKPAVNSDAIGYFYTKTLLDGAFDKQRSYYHQIGLLFSISYDSLRF